MTSVLLVGVKILYLHGPKNRQVKVFMSFRINKYFLPDTKFQSFYHEKIPALCTVLIVIQNFPRPSPSPQKDL